MDMETKKVLDQNEVPFCLHGLEKEQREQLCEDMFNGEDFTA